MCVCVCVNIHTYIDRCIYIDMYIYIYIMCIHTHTLTHTHTHTRNTGRRFVAVFAAQRPLFTRHQVSRDSQRAQRAHAKWPADGLEGMVFKGAHRDPDTERLRH